MKKTILKNATLLPDATLTAGKVHVVVENEKITEITAKIPEITPDTEVVDCGGNLLIPAFTNAHCHAAMTLFRGYGEDLPLQEWLDLKILPAEERLTYRSVNVATKYAVAEMLRNGIASFTDMYMFEDAVADAVLETGIKANISRSIVTFDPDIDMTKDSRMAEAVELARNYHGAGNGKLLVDMAIHAEYTNVPRACFYIADYAAEKGLRVHLHLSETEREHLKCLEKYGKTPTEFFRDLGVLDVPVTAAHCVWVSDGDMEILKEKNVSVVHNPISNLKLGSGVMRLRRMLDQGINVALGSDGTASNNRLDVLREMQTAAVLHKGIQRDPAVIKAWELPALATVNGSLSQGRNDCGKIAVGYRADLTLIDRNALQNLPNYDDYTMLAYSAESHDVLMTMVDGSILYRNGEYISIDEERLRAEFAEVVAHYFE